MKNELFWIGPLVGYSYGLMIGIGVIAAYLVAEHRAKKQGLQDDLVFWLAGWCLAGGILGAKLLFVITMLPEIVANPSILLNIENGFVVYGGIIFGILAGYLFTRRHKIDFLKYFDLVMPSIALAQGFGRIGCLMAGCCYGMQTDSPFHLVFHNSSLAPNGVPLIPTQPISSVLNFLHFFLLIWFARRKKADGQVAGLYLICYSVGRFIIEFFRGDLERGQVGALSTSQFISLFLVVAGLIVFFGAPKWSARKAVAAEDVEDTGEGMEGGEKRELTGEDMEDAEEAVETVEAVEAAEIKPGADEKESQ